MDSLRNFANFVWQFLQANWEAVTILVFVVLLTNFFIKKFLRLYLRNKQQKFISKLKWVTLELKFPKAKLKKPEWMGHAEGAKRVEEIIELAHDKSIEYITIWGGSYDNLTKRSKAEIKALDQLYQDSAKKIIKNKKVKENGVRFRFVGEWNKVLSPKTIEAITRAEEATKSNAKYNVTILIGYNGDREMISAINKLVSQPRTFYEFDMTQGGMRNNTKKVRGQTAKGGLPINESALENALWTGDLPAVDLIVRTGGNEPHLSNGFMMWHAKNAELYFSDKYWPDFKDDEFERAIGYYEGRERRFGK